MDHIENLPRVAVPRGEPGALCPGLLWLSFIFCGAILMGNISEFLFTLHSSNFILHIHEGGWDRLLMPLPGKQLGCA